MTMKKMSVIVLVAVRKLSMHLDLKLHVQHVNLLQQVFSIRNVADVMTVNDFDDSMAYRPTSMDDKYLSFWVAMTMRHQYS